MSILDNPFGDAETQKGAMLFAARMTAEALPNLDEGTRRILELTADGTFLGDALGVTKEQKAAMLDMGCRLIQVGELEKASDVLLRLNQLDPLMEGALYALGVICQTRGELQKAAFMYTQFLALDATNPMGYLRVGECLIQAGEFVEAKATLELARTFAADGKGQPGNLAEAKTLLALPDVASAPAPRKQ